MFFIPCYSRQKSFFSEKSVYGTNKFENTEFYILWYFNYQNYLLIRYCMLHNKLICICVNVKSLLVHQQIKRKKIVVSATRRRRDIKIPLCLSVPVRKSLILWVTTMDARKSAIFSFQFVKPILQNIIHFIQYTILEIHFWSLKFTNATVRKNL